MVIQMQDELASGAVANTDLQMESKEIVQAKIAALQQSVAEANLAEHMAKEDCAKLFEMLELMKEKYGTLLEQNAGQAKELIKSEEDKLSIARALVELKLLHNELQETAEKEKFEASSTILANKNELLELDEALQQHKLSLVETQESLRVSEAALAKERDDAISLRAALVEVRGQLEKESERNLELSAELLTVVNQRDYLSAQLAESRKSEERSAEQAKGLREEAEALRRQYQEVKESFVEAQEELVRVRQSCMMAEMEVILHCY
jgi:hypothetical protein